MAIFKGVEKMSVITIFSGIYCDEKAVIQNIVEGTGHILITDDKVTTFASELSGIKKDKLEQAFSSKTSVFNKFTHEKEASIAYLKLAVAKLMAQENIIISGYAGQLIPKNISHVLRVCLFATTAFRLDMAEMEGQLSKEEANQVLALEDQDRAVWTNSLFSIKDPWDPALYDIVLPMEKNGHGEASALIKESLLKDAVKPTEKSKAALENFILAAETEAALVNAGHNVTVTADTTKIILTIDKQVLMLNRLEEELKTIAGKVPGVSLVETRVEEGSQKPMAYRKRNRQMPSRLLLVDDEKEFVQTLSERLQMRDMGSVVAYDGQSALDMVHNDTPEVMIIDLKMPGIDGMEVLREVKLTRSEIEVIVLTGHGSEQDREMCMNLGAFAYMQKPVDINVLSETLKEAHEKIKAGE